MKNLILAFSLSIISTFSFGSHLSGGEITSRNIGGLTYEVTLTLGGSGQCFPGNYTLLTGFNYSNSAGTWTVFHSGNYLNLLSNISLYMNIQTFEEIKFFLLFFCSSLFIFY